MPTETGRAFTTGNFLANLAALKAINFGSTDPAGVWFLLPNSTTGNVEVWVWQPTSTETADDIATVRPDSIVPNSPGRCIQQLRFDPSQLGGVLAAIALLNTAGLIERTAQGGAGIVELSGFIRTLLNDADAAAARTTLGIGDVATRTIGTGAGQLRDAADPAYSDARTPLSHASSHLLGGTDVFDAALTRQTIQLDQVTNTSDVNKPVSTAQQTALNLKANLASPTFTGVPLVPTATAGTNTLQAANTAFVFEGLALKANLVSPAFTGTVTGITATMVGLGNVNNTSDTAKPVSTAQQTALDLKANLASPTFTGTPLVPTATAGTNTTQAASTAFVSTAVANLIASSPATLDTLNELATALGNDPSFATSITALIGTKLSIASNLSDLNNRQSALNTLSGGVTANRVLRGNGTNITLSQVDLTTDVTGNLPAANGGLTTGTQTITGNKTLSSVVIIPNTTYGLNIAPAADNYNTCRFTASDASYWDFGVAPVTSGKVFYISSGTAGGGLNGFQINASNYNLSISGILSVTNTTQSTSTTTGAQVIAGGQAVGGNQYIGGSRVVLSGLPTSASGLPSGALWRNGNVVNIV